MIDEGVFKFYRRRPQRFLMKIKNLDCITDMRRNGFKVIHEKPKSAEETQRIPRELWRQEENPRSMNSDKSLLLHCSLRRAELESWEINAAQIRNKWNCRPSCTTSERRNFVSIGSVWTARKLVGRSHGVLLLLQHVQDPQADVQTLYERRFKSPLDGPIISFGAEVKFYPIPISSKTKVECISSEHKSFLVHSLETPWTREEVGLAIFWRWVRRICKQFQFKTF